MARKSAAKKAGRKVVTKTSVSAAKQPEKTKDDHPRGMDSLVLELLTYPNVTILSATQSKRVIEKTEVNGCIARPENTTTRP